MDQKKILVVDDEEDVRVVTAATLKRYGYSVITASSAEEAVEVVKSELPDLVLLDILMPGMHGAWAGEIIKKDPKTSHIPIIYVTALLTRNEEGALQHKIGDEFFISKPWDTESLLQEIRKRIG